MYSLPTPGTSSSSRLPASARDSCRVLVTGVPIPGHVMPLLPLAHAIAATGSQVTMAVAPSMAHLVGEIAVLPTGPDIDVLLTENARRTGGADLGDISALAQFFTATRIDTTFDEALSHAHRIRPDLIVTDEYDTIGPMLAAALTVPWVQHAIGLPVSPPALAPAMQDLLVPQYVRRGIVKTGRLALVDPWPQVLQEPGHVLPPDRLAIRPQPYTASTTPGGPAVPAPGLHPRVLVTLGTVLLDGELLDALVDAVATLDNVEVLALVPPGVTHPLTDPRGHVQFLGFTPMADLLAAGVSVIVAAGGAGTVLAAMSHGIPMVLLPRGAEKPQNAERVVSAGAGIAITDPAQAGTAVRELLIDPSYRAAAGQVGEQISRTPEPGQVWAALRARLRT